jgi:hypothetical protein
VKNFVIVVVLVIVAVLLYKAYVGGESQEKKKPQAESAPRSMVRSGQDVGRSASDAFDRVDIGGNR